MTFHSATIELDISGGDITLYLDVDYNFRPGTPDTFSRLGDDPEVSVKDVVIGLVRIQALKESMQFKLEPAVYPAAFKAELCQIVEADFADALIAHAEGDNAAEA